MSGDNEIGKSLFYDPQAKRCTYCSDSTGGYGA